jgi:hydrogenase-1 operon protein HyaF
MKPFPVSVRMVGPGSQPPEDEPLDFIPMPSAIATYAMPQVPDKADPHALTRVRNVLADFARKIDQGAGAHPTTGLLHLDAPSIELLNEVLGSGEVSIKLRAQHTPHPPLRGGEVGVSQSAGFAPTERRAHASARLDAAGGDGYGRDGEIRIQETVFAGVWRVLRYATDGVLVADELVAAPIPQVVVDIARIGAMVGLPRVDVPAGAMNSPALLTEIRENVRRRMPRGNGHAFSNGHAAAPNRVNAAAHVINLSLLPLTPEDHQVLNLALPVGPVAIMSRSFGNCRVTSTGTRDVWRVQYFNSMQTMILNTIEIVELPEVALASDDDLADSQSRIAELIEWLNDSAAEPAS